SYPPGRRGSSCPWNAVGDAVKYWQKPHALSFIYSETRKKFETTSKSIRIDVDSVRALAQYFFEARKNRGLCAGPRVSLVAPYAAQGG
ncbi:hypothetical protein, partial [Mesorhizobium sp. M7A.F.Ca.US.006.01.1.1]|uniref:hypothetical protein n=1 Tax=Mesorhizobium sp. M7A.F.Ca.US.006.01.1.1 TaxID=2496707 RepID=UPI0019D1B65C